MSSKRTLLTDFQTLVHFLNEDGVNRLEKLFSQDPSPNAVVDAVPSGVIRLCWEKNQDPNLSAMRARYDSDGAELLDKGKEVLAELPAIPDEWQEAWRNAATVANVSPDPDEGFQRTPAKVGSTLGLFFTPQGSHLVYQVKLASSTNRELADFDADLSTLAGVGRALLRLIEDGLNSQFSSLGYQNLMTEGECKRLAQVLGDLSTHIDEIQDILKEKFSPENP